MGRAQNPAHFFVVKLLVRSLHMHRLCQLCGTETAYARTMPAG